MLQEHTTSVRDARVRSAQLDDGKMATALDVALNGSLFSMKVRGPRRRSVETTQSVPIQFWFEERSDRGSRRNPDDRIRFTIATDAYSRWRRRRGMLRWKKRLDGGGLRQDGLNDV